MTEPRCCRVKPDGAACAVTVDLCPTCGCCLWHCEHRRDQAQTVRVKGGDTTARRTAKVRVVSADAVPGGKPPETLDDCVTWASWLAFQSVTGALDGTTVREANRSLGTLKDSLNKAHLLARI